jgi:hypothetical protein
MIKEHNIIFEDPVVIGKINKYLDDPWSNTPFSGYVYLTPSQKGQYGEYAVKKYLEQNYKKTITNRINPGHDIVVENHKVEVKFSVACRSRKKDTPPTKNNFIINHIATHKDWDRLIFCGINYPGEAMLVWFSKEDFAKHIQSGTNTIFNRQQGGNTGTNDDYVCTKIDALLELDWVHTLDKW